MDDIRTRNPIELFQLWLAEAEEAEPSLATAACLATVDSSGAPAARMVLLKGADKRGFVFYTNLDSRKGQELITRPRGALCFHWKSLQRQVRIEGPAQQVSPFEADAYFATRPRNSQIAAWASEQSRPVDSRATLESRFAEAGARFGDNPVPRPPSWSGFRIVAEMIEFWAERPHRMHDRMRFSRAGFGWNAERLYP